MKSIDCLIIENNRTGLNEILKQSEFNAVKTPLHTEISLSCVKLDNKYYSASEIYNMFANDDRKFYYERILSNTIAYLGTYLNKHGFSFDYISCFRDAKDKLIELLSNNITVIAITTTYYMSILPVMEIIRFIKRYNKNALIIVGGPLINNLIGNNTLNEEIMSTLKNMSADIYVNNPQGENALINVIKTIKNGLSLDGIDNILYKHANEYVKSAFYNEEILLNDNGVNWRLFSDTAHQIANVRTAISCYHNCAFCSYPQLQGKYQMMSVAGIEKELLSLKEHTVVKRIMFVDDTFNLPRHRFIEFLTMMIKNNFGFKWSSYLRCQYLDDETARMMMVSGCEGVLLGIESGSQTVLNNMKKNVTIPEYEKGISLLKKYGINIIASFMRGFPGETNDTARETDEFIERTKPDYYVIKTWYYTKGTPVEAQANEFGLNGYGYEWRHKTMDAKTAAESMVESFLRIQNSIWLPTFNFDYPSVYILQQCGLSNDNVKRFVTVFGNYMRNTINNDDNGKFFLDKVKSIISENRGCNA